MSDSTESKIVKSWQQNADAWIDVIQKEEIESRKLVTNQAIIDAVTAYQPATALDVGCGEGWLARALIDRSIAVLGIDVVEKLIQSARKLGAGRYEVCSYEELAAGRFSDLDFDAVVCNFSLLGKESVEIAISAMSGLLASRGHLFVQTLHPVVVCGELPYEDGWRPGSWDGVGTGLTNPAPWYFRTLESWVSCLTQAGLSMVECREPLHPKTGLPASVLFICRSAQTAED